MNYYAEVKLINISSISIFINNLMPGVLNS